MQSCLIFKRQYNERHSISMESCNTKGFARCLVFVAPFQVFHNFYWKPIVNRFINKEIIYFKGKYQKCQYHINFIYRIGDIYSI